MGYCLKHGSFEGYECPSCSIEENNREINKELMSQNKELNDRIIDAIDDSTEIIKNIELIRMQQSTDEVNQINDTLTTMSESLLDSIESMGLSISNVIETKSEEIISSIDSGFENSKVDVQAFNIAEILITQGDYSNALSYLTKQSD